MANVDTTAPAQGGGILGRFENVRTKQSRKRIVVCSAATSQFQQYDYLKPQHMPVDRVDQETNFHPASNVNETRFHRGFQRRHKSDIQPDAARLEVEVAREMTRDDRAHDSIEATREHKARHTFNILTGEGDGRECEYRTIGKRIVNPFNCMEAVFSDHQRDASNRTKASKHRFFEYPAVQKEVRQKNLVEEGFVDTKRETAILGYGNSGVTRCRARSCGAPDAYSHLQRLPPEPEWERGPLVKTKSQVILG